MEHKTHYATVSTALEELRKQGFTVDFNLQENSLVYGDNRLKAEDFDIVDVYRYEGNSDPGDEAAVYAIQSKTGVKGVLVTGYGASEDMFSTEILSKLKDHH